MPVTDLTEIGVAVQMNALVHAATVVEATLSRAFYQHVDVVMLKFGFTNVKPVDSGNSIY